MTARLLILLAVVAIMGCEPVTASPGTESTIRPAVVDAWNGSSCRGDCQAAEALFSPSYRDCLGQAGSTGEVKFCTGQEGERQEAALERLYHRRLEAVPADVARRLRASQAAWREVLWLRAEAVGFEYGTGTEAEIESLRAALYMTAQRRADLERMSSSDKGG